MKKEYQKPALFCEELRPEEMLCGCDLRNPEFNEVQMCGYTLDKESLPPPLQNLGLKIFAEGWNNCYGSVLVDMDAYCYHPGPQNVFSS